MAGKYTLGEAALIFIAGPILMGLVAFLLVLPMALFDAWIASIVWNWFAVPYFHLPTIHVWLMLMVAIFVGFFRGSYPALKDEFLRSKGWNAIWPTYVAKGLLFGIAWMTHLWILKG